MGSFPYNQVHLGDGHFRLLLLLPSSSPEEPVTFSLVQINKTNALRYIAVSYTWGTQPFDHSVCYYGQKEMKVTKSCSDVLTTLRGHGVQFVWIDQLCIDQSSPAEKSRQILLMNHIYAGASYVSIWLGTVPELYIGGSMHNLGLTEDEIPSASSVLDCDTHHPAWARELLDRTLPLFDRLCGWVWSLSREQNPNISLSSDLANEKLALDDQRAWQLILGFFNHPYFGRRWIVQEVASNENVIVLLGMTSLRFERILACSYALSALQQGSAKEVSAIIPAAMEERLVKSSIKSFQLLQFTHAIRKHTEGAKSSGSPWLKLTGLLSYCREFETKEALDQVYALQALATERSILPAPDYSLPLEDSLLSITLQLIESGQGPVLVSLAGDHFKPLFDTLPSWCPNWASRDPTSKTILPTPLFHMRHMADSQENFEIPRAAGATQAEMCVLPDKKTLKTTGSIVDRITAVESTAHLVLKTNVQLCYQTCIGFVQKYGRPESFSDLMRQELISEYLSRPLEEVEAKLLNALVQSSIEGLEFCLAALSAPPELLLGEDWRGKRDQEPYRKSMAVFLGRGFLNILRQYFLCATSQGFIGFVPPSLALGDELAILHGVDMPMVVRRVDGGHYRLIGAAFILGWMRGEALGLESYSSTEINLV